MLSDDQRGEVSYPKSDKKTPKLKMILCGHKVSGHGLQAGPSKLAEV